MKLNEPYRISLSTQYEANYVLVIVHDHDANIGFGEASPLPAYRDETQQSIIDVIDKKISKALIGLDEFSISKIVESLDEQLPGNLMAKSAVEMAIHDLIARKLKMSLVKYLGGPVREFIEVAGSIGFLSPPKASSKARSLVEGGVTTLKIKIGQGIEKDSELVRVVRETVGNDVKIRLDANQAYEVEKAIPLFKKLETFVPELFEQPVEKSKIEDMARIAKALDTPLMADEPIVTSRDVISYAESGAADLIKVKLNRCGGIRKTLAICDLARTYDLKVVIGSGHESSLGVAAESALALTNSNFHSVGEMNGNQRLSQELVLNPLIPQFGKIKPWEAFGLGLELKITEHDIVA